MSALPTSQQQVAQLGAAKVIAIQPLSTQVAPTLAVGLAAGSDPASAQTAATRFDTLLLEELRRPELGALRDRVETLLRFPRRESGFPTLRPPECKLLSETLQGFVNQNRALLASGEPLIRERLEEVIALFRATDLRSYPNEQLRLDLVLADALMASEDLERVQALLAPWTQRPYLIEGDFGLTQRLFLLDSLAQLTMGRVVEMEHVGYGRLRYLSFWKPRQSTALFRSFEAVLVLGHSARGAGPAEWLLTCLARLRFRMRLGRRKSALVRPLVRASNAVLGFIAGSLLYLLSKLARRPSAASITAGYQGQPPAFARGPSLAQRATRALRHLPTRLTPTTTGAWLRHFPHWRRLFSALPTLLQRPKPFQALASSQEAAAHRTREQEYATSSLPIPIGRSIAPPGWEPQPEDVLVSRAMGGLGDIVMMTPGLHALARRLGRPVCFATRKIFFPLLENNPDIVLLDIEAEIPVGRFRRWYNFSDCPAGRYESRARPIVKRGRVELFARALGASRRALRRHGWQPRVELATPQRAIRAEIRAELGASGLPLVGVQPYSRDSYKNVLGMERSLLRLAETTKILVFHTSRVPLPEHPNIHQFVGRPLRDILAIIDACDYFIGVDSGFYHVAAGFGIPSIGLFGPTGGTVLSHHHPAHQLAEPALPFPCIPCWRNEDLPCYLTGQHGSACLAAMTETALERDLKALMQRYPLPMRGNETIPQGQAATGQAAW